MARKTAYEQSLATDGWTSFDPVDSGLLERLSKKDILEGEELHASGATVLEGGKAQASCKASQLSSHTLRLKQMPRYFSRSCPRCGSFFGLVLRQLSSRPRVLSVDGLCITCRYGINWALVRGRALAIKVHKKRLPIRATRSGL
jgi:hypothetical protein